MERIFFYVIFNPIGCFTKVIPYELLKKQQNNITTTYGTTQKTKTSNKMVANMRLKLALMGRLPQLKVIFISN
jgi:hypothetical protein